MKEIQEEEDTNAERDKNFRFLIQLLEKFSRNPKIFSQISQLKDEANKLFSELVFALESYESASFLDILSIYNEWEENISRVTNEGNDQNRLSLFISFVLEGFSKVLKCVDFDLALNPYTGILLLCIGKQEGKQTNQALVNCKSAILNCLYSALMLDILKRTRKFSPELLHSLISLLSFLKTKGNVSEAPSQNITFDSLVENLILKEKDESAEDGLLNVIHQKTLFLLKNSIPVYSADINFNILFQPVLNLLNDIKALELPEKLQQEYDDLAQRVENICEESIPKGNLDIVKEKAVIKIQQLTPRLLEKRSKFNKPEEGSKESIKRLKKAVNRNKKMAMGALKKDMKVVHEEKKILEKHKNEEKKAKHKRFLAVMDEHHKEYKKMKTTQLQHKERYKNKKKRMAGSEMENPLVKKIKK